MASSDDEEVSKLPDKCQSLRQRSIRKRIETERNKHLPKQRKQRERPAPLSKYREALTDFASGHLHIILTGLSKNASKVAKMCHEMFRLRPHGESMNERSLKRFK